MTKHVELFTDGACSGNPGPGGWGAILRASGTEKLLCGSEKLTTNNRMEMMAVIGGLKALKTRCSVDITTDSQYVFRGMTQWLAGWKRRGWKNSSGHAVKNIDLWQELDALSQKHLLRWHWTRGHAGHPENERADALARAAIERMNA